MSADLRSVHWREIRDYINPMCHNIHEKMRLLQKATGSELANHFGLPVTSVRPRMTNLRDLGLVEETGVRRNNEHEFRYVSLADAERNRQAATQTNEKQLQFIA